MNTDTPVKVIFRLDKAGDVIAFFPELPGTNDPYFLTCYQHIGQHSAASPDYYRYTKAAKPEEYSALFKELESLGYKLRPIKRMTWSHLQARKQAIKAMEAK